MSKEKIYTLEEATALVEKAAARLEEVRTELAVRRNETESSGDTPDKGHYVFNSIPDAVNTLNEIVSDYDEVRKSLAVPGHVATVQESRLLTSLFDRMGL